MGLPSRKWTRLRRARILIPLFIFFFIFSKFRSHSGYFSSGSKVKYDQSSSETPRLRGGGAPEKKIETRPLISPNITVQQQPYSLPERLRKVFPHNRRSISTEQLKRLTNRESTAPKFIFLNGSQSKKYPIPEFPKISPPAINTDIPIDDRDDDGRRRIVTSLLDNQYEYSNQIYQNMADLVQEQPYLENVRANACIFMVCQNSDLGYVLKSLMDFESAFNRRFRYPYVLLNDAPFDESFKQVVMDAVGTDVEFGLISQEHWSLPIDIDERLFQEKLAESKGKYDYGDSRTYRLKARYQSRYFYKHPLLQNYRYYWRIEPNVQYGCMIRYDPLLYMALTNKRYGFTVVSQESLATVPGLWEQTTVFMQEYQLPLSKFLAEAFYDPSSNDYNGNHFWSNFEIADMEFYRSDLYEKYLNQLDKSHGFFYHRYGDAPVHSLAAAMLLHPSEIHHFSDISYYYKGQGTCPVSSNPNLYNFKSICWCDRQNGWVEHDWWPVNLVSTISSLNKWSNTEKIWE